MSLHQTNKDKPRAQKCRHFCFSFDLHNYCPTCREAGKGDDPCVTFETPCDICASFKQTNLEKSLGNSLNIHLQQQMGSFQASMLEAFQSLREELTAKKQTEVDQTSFLASKPRTFQ